MGSCCLPLPERASRASCWCARVCVCVCLCVCEVRACVCLSVCCGDCARVLRPRARVAEPRRCARQFSFYHRNSNNPTTTDHGRGRGREKHAVRDGFGKAAGAVWKSGGGVCGTAAGAVRKSCGSCAGKLRELCGKAAGAMRKSCGSYAEKLRNSCGKAAGAVRKSCGTAAEKLRKSCGTADRPPPLVETREEGAGRRSRGFLLTKKSSTPGSSRHLR